MKKLLLTLGLSIAAITMSFNGISQTSDANVNKAETVEVSKETAKEAKKACCAKGTSKKACTAAKSNETKSSASADNKLEAKATTSKSCAKSSKKGACCASKSNEKAAKVENMPTEVKEK